MKKQERAGILKRRKEEEAKQPRRYSVDFEDAHPEGEHGLKPSLGTKQLYVVEKLEPKSRAERLGITYVFISLMKPMAVMPSST